MMVAAVDKGGNILVLNTYRNMVPVIMNEKEMRSSLENIGAHIIQMQPSTECWDT